MSWSNDGVDQRTHDLCHQGCIVSVSSVRRYQRSIPFRLEVDRQHRRSAVDGPNANIVALLIVNRPEAKAFVDQPWYQWPGIWIQATHLSLAHWVGFITLIGIVSRNGIMMISHYQHLMEVDGMPFGKEMIIRGSLERLAPVMMTAMTSFVGLIPLLFGYGEPGKEILYPLSVVLFGGMIASTALDQIVTPALFYLFGSAQPASNRTMSPND